MSPTRKLMMALAGLGVVLAASGAWLFIEEPGPDPEPEVVEATEADPSREETEDLMRKIGYVQ